MQIKTEYGEDILSLPSYAWCKVANKDIEDMDKCPLYNFDDNGKICVPSVCEHYTEDKDLIERNKDNG